MLVFGGAQEVAGWGDDVVEVCILDGPSLLWSWLTGSMARVEYRKMSFVSPESPAVEEDDGDDNEAIATRIGLFDSHSTGAMLATKPTLVSALHDLSSCTVEDMPVDKLSVLAE